MLRLRGCLGYKVDVDAGGYMLVSTVILFTRVIRK